MTKCKKNENLKVKEIAAGLEKGVEAVGKLLTIASENVVSTTNKVVKRKDSNLTYLLGRTCFNCGAPLADQLSLKRTYCEEIRDEHNNLIKDCKAIYNRRINKPSLDEQTALVKEIKTTDKRIEQMIAKKGDVVTTEDLDAYDIQLSSPLSYKINPYGQLTSFFLGYIIISNPISELHKIYRNDQ